MKNISLPELRSINIKDFSLYPRENGLDLTFDFINGINLIVGGNGMGKTTFLYLIKYGILGNYKKSNSVRIYKEGNEKINRIQHSEKYFSNRMDSEFESNENSKLTIEFKIGNKIFRVLRSLYKIKLLKVEIIDEDGQVRELDGEIATQKKYQESKERSGYLQFNYEKEITNETGLAEFDSLIFIINEILFFNESRKLILWDHEVQKDLSSKFFIDPKLDAKRSKFKLKKRAHDTKARQASEKRKAIVEAIRLVDNDARITTDVDKTIKEIELTRDKIDSLVKKIDRNQRLRVLAEEQRNKEYAKRSITTKGIDEIEAKITAKQTLIKKELWESKNRKYDIYRKQLELNCKCPMCNQEVENLKKIEVGTCFLCDQVINNTQIIDKGITLLHEKVKSLLISKQASETELANSETELKELDNKYRHLKQNLFDNRSKKRQLEYEIELREQKNDKSDNVEDDEFRLGLLAQIESLEELRDREYDLSKDYAKKVKEIELSIEKEQIKVVSDLSKIFNSYAGRFLGLKCELAYESIGKSTKVFVPKVDGIPRANEEEFSESQRFFVDLSFRMSILNYFHNSPSFMMCETPDSSLDISYEENAAEVFLQYLELPNALILSSNFNNSRFLEYMVNKSKNTKLLNLLKIGRKSAIQSNSTELMKISDKIEKMIKKHG